ncbi:hypothetical protein [Methylocella sp.]|uniref:hypothetical protein n=1 Tax=Methylocella sp. TaxID=1978226 RepID=UPI0035B13AAA
MNKKIASFIALAALGFCAAAPAGASEALRSPGVSTDDVTGSIAAPAAERQEPLRVTCANGLARDGQTQHRGWFCRMDPAPEAR